MCSRYNPIKIYTPKHTKLHHIFKNFSCSIILIIIMPPSFQHIWVQINYNYFFMKIAILVSKYTPRRINRNMFSKFLYEKYHIASVYLK